MSKDNQEISLKYNEYIASLGIGKKSTDYALPSENVEKRNNKINAFEKPFSSYRSSRNKDGKYPA